MAHVTVGTPFSFVRVAFNAYTTHSIAQFHASGWLRQRCPAKRQSFPALPSDKIVYASFYPGDFPSTDGSINIQLYSARWLCYNSLVLGVSRCTGQEISACRDASFGRSKLGRSKLGRNGDCSGTSAPIRLKKKIGKRNDSAETLTVFGGITLKTIRSNFAAGARAVPLKQRDEAAIRSAASLFAFLYGASLVGAATGFAGRRPRGGRKDGRIGRKQHGFWSSTL